MKFLIYFSLESEHKPNNNHDLKIPSDILDDKIRRIISKPVPFELIKKEIRLLLPIFSFYCGIGALQIKSDCHNVILIQKRPYLYRLKPRKNNFFNSSQERLIKINGSMAEFLSPYSSWLLTSSIVVISEVIAMLQTHSQLTDVLNFIQYEPDIPNSFPYSNNIATQMNSIKIDLIDQLHLYNSRKGFDLTRPIGATFPYNIDPPSLIYKPKYPLTDKALQLEPPDLKKLSQESFCSVISRRRSFKSLDTSDSLSLKDLSTFLGLVFHTSQVYMRNTSIPNAYDSCRRFYPNGGGVHELEPFIICNRVSDLKSGVYYYSAIEHHLLAVSYSQSDIRSMIAEAYYSSNKESIPAAFIILTSRLERLAWKYERMAYHVTLKNAGVILGYMSQIASYLNLFGCPMGNSDTYRFSKIIQEDPLRMPSVGEFCLSPIKIKNAN